MTIRRTTGNISNVIPAEAGNSYTYDYVGNRLTMMVTDGSGTRTHVYSHDNMMLLRAKRGTWAEKTYTITGAGTHTLRWRYAKDGSEYAGEDRGWVDYVQWTGAMEEPDPNDWSTLNYVYDPAGRRVEKKYDGRTVLKYVYDGDHCIAEYDAGGALKRKYIYGPSVDEPIAMIESTGSYAGTYYYHFDALGSVVALTDADANSVDVYEYDLYGRVGATDANHPNWIMFTGREFDKETGLYYYRARYYNPQIGRFLQTDPIGYGDGMNVYRYCGNNPLRIIDPHGTNSDAEDNVVESRTDPSTHPGQVLPQCPYPGYWEWINYFTWYMHGLGDALAIDLAKTGLLPYIQADSRVQAVIDELVAKMTKDAMDILKMMGTGVDPLRPITAIYSAEATISFDDAEDWGAFLAGFATGSFPPPLLVLGDTKLVIEGVLNVCSTGRYEIDIHIQLIDSFSNPTGDLFGEWPGGSPYPLEATWDVEVSGTLRRPPSRPSDPSDLP